MKHEGVVWEAQFSSDGRQVLTGSLDGTARLILWDVATGKPLGKPMTHEGSVVAARFSPDGQRLVTA